MTAEESPVLERRVERKLAAIFSADVAGYSRLMSEDEVATIRTLTAYRTAMTDLIRRHQGRVVDSPGDNLLAEFASVVDAVQSAVAIQQEFKTRNADLPAARRMEFRIGVNLGDVIVEGERIYGDGVNIAARLESLAEAGGICLSGTVYDQIEGKLALPYDSLGEQTVKNITKPVRVYRVRTSATVPMANIKSVMTPALPDEPSIAVLPFVNMSSDPEQEYFSDGITEDLITDLSKLSRLFVISRNSVFLYKGKTVNPKQVSQDLGVQYVLEGSVRKAGNRVRITAQLVDTDRGYHVWADRYDRELQDIFALQDEITQKIVAALAVKLTEGERERLTRRYTGNLEAYDYYLRGLEYSDCATQETNTLARQMFEQALALDPQFATAYAELGWVFFEQWVMGWSQDAQTLDQTLAMAQRVLALDGAVADGHQLMAGVFLWKKQHEQAIAEIERAISLDPNNADGYANFAHILNFSGQPAQTNSLLQKAMRLDPQYPVWYLWELGHGYYLTGRYEEGIATMKRILARSPEFLPAHEYLAVIYSELGREEEARAAGAECLRLHPDLPLDVLAQRLPYKDQAILQRVLNAARKAGLK